MTIQLVKCCDNSLNAKARVYWEVVASDLWGLEITITAQGVTTKYDLGAQPADVSSVSNPAWQITQGSTYAFSWITPGLSFSHDSGTAGHSTRFYYNGTIIESYVTESGFFISDQYDGGYGTQFFYYSPSSGSASFYPINGQVEKDYFDVELANLNIENTLVDKILKLISNIDDFLGKFIPVLGGFEKVLNIVELLKPQECLGVEEKIINGQYCLVFHKVIVLDTVNKLLDMLYENTGIKIEIPEIIESIINAPNQLFPWVAQLDEGQFITSITQQIKVVCSPTGVTEYPTYKVECCPDGNCPPANECPPNTCAILCGNTVCCYNKQGKLVKSFKV